MGDLASVAQALGIKLHCSRTVPFVVCSGRDYVVYRWHSAPSQRDARAWLGIAQILLDRAGLSYSADAAADFAARLQRGLSSKEKAVRTAG